MIIGAMNHPAEDVIGEIRWMKEMGLQFVDLTLEPPAAAVWRVDPFAIRDELQRLHMPVIGHTAFYLPLANAFPSVRRAAIDELKKCADVFAIIGAGWMNIHPDRHTPMHDRRFYIANNIESLRELMDHCQSRGVGLMIENLPGDYNSAEQLGELLDPLPELGLHLDIGHANLQVPYNTTREILRAYGSRLRHVHLHDNKGGHADLHLPLGAGNIDVRAAVCELQRAHFSGTITLEVFTPDRHYLSYSRDVLRRIWDQEEAAAAARDRNSTAQPVY